MRFLGIDLETFDDTNPDPNADLVPYRHRIVAIGYMAIDTHVPDVVVESGVLVAAEVPPVPMNERDILIGLNEIVERLNPGLDSTRALSYDVVTYNGLRWDIPVLTMRMFRHGLQVPWMESKDFQYPYSQTGHFDLARYLSGRGQMSPMSAYANAMGLPGKTDVTGQDVQRLVNEGKVDVLADYCMSDVVQQMLIGLRVQFMRGLLGAAQYNVACSRILKHSMRSRYPTVKKLAVSSDVFVADDDITESSR